MRASTSYVRKGAIIAALLMGAAASAPASAGYWHHGGNGGADRRDYGADHDEIYQVQRGDFVCQSRAQCGGVAAIPMNRPGWYYLPRGTYLAEELVPPAPTPRLHRKKLRY
jgi:hypothetical protein